MTEYELHTEEITPCGGAKHAIRKIWEVQAESPEAYVLKHGRFPILEITRNASGDTVIRTGDGHGYFINYYFTE